VLPLTPLQQNRQKLKLLRKLSINRHADHCTRRRRQQKDAAAKEGSQKDKTPAAPTTAQFPAGSYIVRMDQPYSRIADALLDHQYWSPNDPQKTPYDDTGWTFGELYNVRVVRVTDATCSVLRWSA